MIEPRIYRAAFLPALLAVVLVMFSLENRPAPLPQGLAADILFEGPLAKTELRRIVEGRPDRRAGSPGDAATARLVAERLAELGFEVEPDAFDEQGRDLVNVVGRRVGASRRQVVVLAGRDARGVPDAAVSGADTAALLELARVFEGRVSRKTLVLVSADGSTLGEAGARRFAERALDRELIDAVLVLSNMGAIGGGGSPLVAWSNDARRGSIGLQRTAASALRQELTRLPGDPGPVEQLNRLAFPLGLGAQGVLLERDVEAIRFSGSGELPPASARARSGDVDAERLEELGRGALRTAFALDSARAPEHGPRSYVVVVRKVLPGWALSLLALTLLLPPLAASIDAFARARRRREGVVSRWPWLAAAIVPFLAALGAAELLVLAGWAPDAPPAPIPPAAEPLDGRALAALGACVAVAALTWLAAHRLIPGAAGGDPAAPGAGCAAALALALAALAVWFVNPFTALLLIPAAHLWTLACLSEVPRRGAALLAGGGLLPLALAALLYLDRLSLDPLEGSWYLFLLVTGHHAGLASTLLGCLLLGALAAVVAIAAARPAGPAHPPTAPDQRLRGPGGYAGPGSLGGTDSALR